MSRSDNRKKSDKVIPITRNKKPTNNGTTQYGIGKYYIEETKVLQFPYGKVNFNIGDVLLCPHAIPIRKRLIAPIEDVYKPFTKDINLNGKFLLIERYGGAGDILCMMPAIYEIKKKYPNANIGIMCSYSYINIVHNFPKLLHGGVNNVVLFDSVKDVDYFISLEGYLENYPNKEIDIHRVYADGLYQSLDNDSISGAISHNHLMSQASIGRQGIGIQYSTNALVRDYNIDSIIEVIRILNDKYPNEIIHLLGPGDDYLVANYIQAQTNGSVMVNGCGRTPMSFMETFELVNTLKCVIAPDSSMTHFAGFNNTPIVGLYGPFSSNSRISRYTNAIGLDGTTTCSPCNRHSPFNWCPHTGSQGLCTNAIAPVDIVEAVDKLMVLYS